MRTKYEDLQFTEHPDWLGTWEIRKAIRQPYEGPVLGRVVYSKSRKQFITEALRDHYFTAAMHRELADFMAQASAGCNTSPGIEEDADLGAPEVER